MDQVLVDALRSLCAGKTVQRGSLTIHREGVLNTLLHELAQREPHARRKDQQKIRRWSSVKRRCPVAGVRGEVKTADGSCRFVAWWIPKRGKVLFGTPK
jgi:hypothetical protein